MNRTMLRLLLLVRGDNVIAIIVFIIIISIASLILDCALLSYMSSIATATN
jgi:hypothetical protein